jgi:hypothetical protein
VGSLIIAAEGFATIQNRVAMARMKLTEAPKLPVAWRRAPENLKGLEVEAKFLDARFREEFGVRLGVIFIDTLAAAYDADWFRAGLAKRRITPCIPSKANRKTAIPYDALLYKQRHKIENMFGRLKDWRRIHTQYDRCALTYFSAICIAAAVIFWL